MDEKKSRLDEITRGLKWSIAFRIIFSIILIFSTLVLSFENDSKLNSQPFFLIYLISILILLFSLFYALLLKIKGGNYFIAYLQLTLDSFFVTGIIFITGSFESIFTFLYLVVIISSSLLVLRRGSMIIATLCSLQYGILIDLEYYGVISPFGNYPLLSSSVDWTYVIYRILVIVTACFAVAFLSGILAMQAKRARRDLKVMEDHLKRVERMAAMGELASGMAHEIKNPLASLSGSIQLLKEDTEPGTPKHRLMQIVLRETERLSRIVTDFLLFAKPYTGNARPIRLDKAIMETVELFKQDPLCRERIEFRIKVDLNVWINMDPDHLQQVLWNLLKNAAEAIDGKGRIDVRLKSFKNNQARLSITDDGCGIPIDEIDTVFNPFITTKTDGTGLGLSIIHRMVDSYGGLIDIESRPGHGSMFTLILKRLDMKQNLDT